MGEITREKAMDLAVKYLSFKSRTSSEMVGYLKKKNVPDTIISEVMQKLDEYHYIDDAVYLKNYLENNRQLNCYGSRRLLQDLKKRGLSDDLLLLLVELFPREVEMLCCEMVAKKSLVLLKGQTPFQQKKKVYEKLGRMGYPTEMVLEVIKNLELTDESMELSEDDLVWEEKKQQEKLDRDFQKYLRTQRQKGLAGKVLIYQIKKSLMGRGYPYELINEKIEAMQEELLDE